MPEKGEVKFIKRNFLVTLKKIWSESTFRQQISCILPIIYVYRMSQLKRFKTPKRVLCILTTRFHTAMRGWKCFPETVMRTEVPQRKEIVSET